MYNKYNEKKNISKKNILYNCKLFLSKKILKLYPIEKDEEAILQKFIDLSSKRFGHYNKKLDKVSIINNNLKDKTAFISTNETKRIYKIKLNKKENIEKNKFKRIKSAIKLNNNKNMQSNVKRYITQPKVECIIKSLLSNNNQKLKSISKKEKFSIKNFVNPNNYVDIKVKRQFDDSVYKSYNQQMKYFLNKKLRKNLIDGVIDYHKNLKHYKEIYFDSFYVNISKNKRKNNLSMDNILNINNNSCIKPSSRLISGLKKIKIYFFIMF